MKCFTCGPKAKSLFLLLSRVILGIIFIKFGWDKLSNVGATTEFFSGVGIPLPEVATYLVGIVELVGGVALVLGFYSRIAATLLAIVLIVAFLVVHLGGIIDGDFAQAQFNLAMMTGTLAILGAGAGKWKLGKNCASCCGDSCDGKKK